MGKGELTVPVVPVLAVIFVAAGAGYLVMDNVNSDPAHIQEVKATSSYQNIAESGDPDIYTHSITQETISFVEENNLQNPPNNLQSKEALFLVAVEFADFSKTKGNLVVVNNTPEEPYVYQLNSEDELVNSASIPDIMSDFSSELMEIERQKMCENVSIEFTAEKMDTYEFDLPKIQVSNFGSGDYEGKLVLELDMVEGENITRSTYNLPSGAIYNFEFENVDSLENVEKAVLIPESCPEDRKVVENFSSD